MTDNLSQPASQKGEESFADMLKASYKSAARIKVGEVAEGKVIAIGKDGIFLDLGIRAEGMLEREECERQGELTVHPGDVLQVLVTSFRDGIFRCTARLRQAGRGDSRAAKDSPSLAMLREAYSGRIPVEGKVKAVNKGGFDVQVMGQKAFCPISQIERNYCHNQETHLEKSYSFLITQFEEDGRNIVISRKELLQAEEKEKAKLLWQELKAGQVREGTVTSVHDYGAFVDIGGAEGLLHISEISYQKIQSAKEVIQPGQQLKVAILKLDPEAGKISLSVKALLADPWTAAGEKLTAGAEFTGKVVHLKPFGAFIELFPGVTGLLHVSRLGVGRRINHPKEILTVDDDVRVRILAVDPQRKTLSLTMEEPEEDFSGELERMRENQDQELRNSGSAMADIFDSAIRKKKE
ncbi:MAG: S1 RNA-binding domain-containing protein [Acidobacteriota bacterium]|nr:S1 RNA-binding domain-containing protein [Acidobacteriota bacterium]